MPRLGGLKEMLKELPLMQEVRVGEKQHGGRWFLNLLVRRDPRGGVGWRSSFWKEVPKYSLVAVWMMLDGGGDGRGARIVVSR